MLDRLCIMYEIFLSAVSADMIFPNQFSKRSQTDI